MQYIDTLKDVKNENFQSKKRYFLIFAQNINCGYTLEQPRRGGSNEYPQTMFRSKIEKSYTPANPIFLYQRTNGPVNAHLKPEIYTKKLV